MKVIHLIHTLGMVSAGVYSSSSGLVESLNHLGVDTTLYGRTGGNNELIQVPHRGFAHWGPAKLGVARGMKSALMTDCPDVLHSHALWAYPSVLSQFFKKNKKIPNVVSIRNCLSDEALTRSRVKKKLVYHVLERRNLQAASCLHALNQREYLALRKLGLRTPIAVIGNGTFPPDIAEGVRRKLRQSDRWVLLHLGRLDPLKGTQELLDRWSTLHRAGRLGMWRLKLVGPGSEAFIQKLQSQCVREGLTDTVEIMPPVAGNEKARLYEEADGFVLPSAVEGQSNAVLEALASGLPALVSPVVASGFDVLRDRMELWEEPFSSERLLQFMCLSEQMDRTREKRALEVRQFVSWESKARCLLEVYHWILGAGPRPPFVHSTAE